MYSIPFCSEISFKHIKEFSMLTEIKDIHINHFGHAIIDNIDVLDTFKSPMARKLEDIEITLSGLRFMIDTGASTTSIKKELLDTSNYTNRTTTVIRTTATGLQEFNAIHDFALKINGICVKISKLDLIDIDSDKFDGIIGWDILSHSCLTFIGYNEDYKPIRTAHLTIFQE